MDTLKGAGIPEVAETVMNHSVPISDEQYDTWMAQLGRELEGGKA